jgi:hypothetical protein
MIPIERTAAGVISVLEQEGSMSVGAMSYHLQQEQVVEPFNLRWEIGSQQEKEWWDVIFKAVEIAIRSGRVGKNPAGVLFLAIRETKGLPATLGQQPNS